MITSISRIPSIKLNRSLPHSINCSSQFSSLDLPIAWNKLDYHPVQNALWNCKKKFVFVVAGRGSGKTELARRKIVLALAFKKAYPNPIYAYCLPTFPQARKVAWYPIISLLPPSWIAPDGINKTESSITTIFGSTLYIVGMDKPHRLEGLQLDGAVLDESSDQRPGVYAKTIIPMLTHRNGWCWRIGVPKKSGIGRIEFRELFEKGLTPTPLYESFYWKSSEILSELQISQVKDQLDSQQYAEQFDATWIDSGGTLYYNFSKDSLLDLAYDPSLPIIVGCDFNVNPMCWILAQMRSISSIPSLHIFDQIFLRETNTPKTLTHLHERYNIAKQSPTNNQPAVGWSFVGDASARANKTSASRSDYLIIKNDIRFGNKKVYFPAKNPKVQDRIACVNAAFLNASNQRRLYIHPRCKQLINDCMIMSYKEGTSEPENYDGTDIGHSADALGYLTWRYMPIKLSRVFSPEVILGDVGH